MTDRTQAQDPSSDDEKILQEARNRMREAVEYYGENHELAKEDIRFRDGDQWPEKVKKEREDKGRPCLTFNDSETFISQVVGDQRQSKPAINVSPTDMEEMIEPDEDDKVPSLQPGEDGEPNQYTMAQVYEGIVRNIEYTSKAENAYDHSFDNSVGSGFGYFRILNEYCDDSFDQELRISRILNQFSVYLDPHAEGVVKEDAIWGFVYTMLSDKEHERLYGADKNGADIWEGLGADESRFWTEGGKKRVTEYYRKVPIKKKLLLLHTGEILDLGKDTAKWDPSIQKVQAKGGQIIKDRIAESHEVQWFKLDGAHIYERTTVPSKYIPIIMVPGKELVKDGKIIWRSLIRYSKDAARNYNYWRSATTELVALAPKAPWVGGEKAFQGFDNEWKNANTENYAYLPFNEDTKHPPQRQPMGQVPTGALEEAQAADIDKKRTIGIYSQGLGQSESANESGRKVMALQREGDVGTFAFVDNLAKAIEHAGRILVDMIPQVYTNERVMRLRNADGTEDFVRINQEIEGRKLYDITRQKFDVAVSVGPSYTTQREKAADMMTRWAEKNPQLWQVIGDLIAGNLDWPGADEMARRLRKTIPPEVLAKDDNKNGIPDNEERPPTPEEQVAMGEIEAKLAKAEADKVKAEAMALKAQADIAEVQKQIAEMPEQIQEMVAQAIAEFMTQAQGSTGAGA